MFKSLKSLERTVTSCRLCPRLVAHRERVAATPPPRYQGQVYWQRPVPGFGDPKARLLVVGLAPAAHGANRTGRMFTGDRSGEWLYRALYEAGFCNAEVSVGPGDGLLLDGAFITATLRCAPPDNKPLPEERRTCEPYLLSELQLLKDVRVVLCLGQIAWNAYLQARRHLGWSLPKKLPKFGHGATHAFDDGIVLMGSYHPSQQNTFTGRLTRPMLRAVFEAAKEAMD